MQISACWLVFPLPYVSRSRLVPPEFLGVPFNEDTCTIWIARNKWLPAIVCYLVVAKSFPLPLDDK